MAIINIDLNKNQELTIRSTGKTKVTAPFLGVGVAGNKFNKVKGMDVATLMQEVSGSGSWFFWELFKKVDPKTNCAEITTTDSNSGHIKKVTRGYQELNALGLVQRVGRGLYMVNPKAIVPEFGRYEELSAKWESLQKS